MPKLRIVLAIGLFSLILLLPPATEYGSYRDILSHTSMTLKGQAPHADVAQDIYGIRALVTNQDPYARLKPALKTIGVDWKAGFSSTHPPTAFLLVAPVAFLPWPTSSMAWAWLMLICLCLSLRFCCDYAWNVALLITAASLYWPPISTSFDQITIVWLFGLAMAFKYRNERPFWSGVFIGIASFTKLFPALLVIPFLLRRNWNALKGFVVSWLIALGILLLLSPKALIRYLTVNQTNAAEIVARWDNGSFLFFLYRRLGMIGLAITVAAIILILVLAFNNYHKTHANEITQGEWNLYALLSVILMPITWIFTIAPLLPNVLLLWQDRRWAIRLIAILAILPPIFMPPWGTRSTIGIFGFLVLAGVSFALAESNVRLSNKLPNLPDQPDKIPLGN